jgi:integrase
MSRVYDRDGVWYVDWTDERGDRHRKSLLNVTSKAEAKEHLAELVAQSRRRKLGLEAAPVSVRSTVWQLVDWWLTHRAPKASVAIERQRLEKHVKPASVAIEQVAHVRATHFEAFFSGLETQLSGASINHVRAKLRTAFERARREGVFSGVNPLLETKKRKVPKRAYETLTLDEARSVLRMIAPQWRGFVATALFLALRKGEIAALRKTDVDLPARVVRIGRSWERDTAKNGEAAELPIVEPLVPYFELAMKAPGPLMFPNAAGKMHPRECDPHLRLRTALRRAGITKHVRLHDMRHTTATLLLRAGVELHQVQRILRHASPVTTAVTYAHLVTPDLRKAMAPLESGTNPTHSTEVQPDGRREAAAK